MSQLPQQGTHLQTDGQGVEAGLLTSRLRERQEGRRGKRRRGGGGVWEGGSLNTAGCSCMMLYSIIQALNWTEIDDV